MIKSFVLALLLTCAPQFAWAQPPQSLQACLAAITCPGSATFTSCKATHLNNNPNPSLFPFVQCLVTAAKSDAGACSQQRTDIAVCFSKK